VDVLPKISSDLAVAPSLRDVLITLSGEITWSIQLEKGCVARRRHLESRAFGGGHSSRRVRCIFNA